MNRASLSRHRATLAGMIALTCGIAAFARCVGFGFVYDDHWTVEGPQLAVPLGRLVGALARGAGRALGIPDETRPAMVLSVRLDHALFGAAPAGYHADSLLLYGLVCAATTWACLAITGRLRVAAVAGLFFALAPLHTEVVCAVNYREDLLAALGVLVPLVALLRKDTPPWLERTAVLAWAVGLFAKESAVVLLPILLWILAFDPRVRARALAHRRLLGGLMVALLVWATWRTALLFGGDDIPRAHYVSLSARLFASARFFVDTGAATLLPFRPSPEHARMAPASPAWLLALAGWVGLVVVLARSRRTRVPALGLALVLIAPLPASPLVGPANELADRYAFLGVVGAGLVYGWLAARLPARAASAVVAAGCVAAFVACQISSAPWRSDRALWSVAVEQAPGSPRAWVGLSRACRLAGDVDEADRAVDRALALDPKFVTAHVTRTYNLLWRGDVGGARAELAVIHQLGGDHHRGVARATECAALPPDGAARCIR